MHAYTSVMGTVERDLLKDSGLLLTWYEILIMLEQAPSNHLTHGALGREVILSRSGVTRVVDRMVKEGLVEREQSSEDRRQSYVKMTPKGRKALDDAGPQHSRNVYELFGKHLHPDEAPAVLAFLARVMGDEENERARRRVANERRRITQPEPAD
jgi:DNA-binding MarR family transcriptional regulator